MAGSLCRYDGNISLPGCDKNMPGTIMAMARLNRPSIMIYGGSIHPGKSAMDGRPLNVAEAFQSYGEAMLDSAFELLCGRYSSAALAMSQVACTSVVRFTSADVACLHSQHGVPVAMGHVAFSPCALVSECPTLCTHLKVGSPRSVQQAVCERR